MFERPQSGEQAILVYTKFSSSPNEEDILEFRELALSAGVEIVAETHCSRKKPDPNLLIGETKSAQILSEIAANSANVVLVNHVLSPIQERNLERYLNCQVLDRTGLILDIFAQRASSHEGRLQVELAQLRHLSTRLVRGWTHLERQKGGIGLRGPGETQLETDRRLIGNRIKQLNKKLEKVRNQRQQGRKARQKAEIPTVSLVGYTNAGKSSLFNRITEANVYAADQLFATLDPTLRRIEISQSNPIILADTVGFIRQLPHDLVAAFHSTLEETRDASVLLHVVDVSHPDYYSCIEQVNDVLKEIGAHEVPQILVFNKIDQIENLQPKLDYDEQGEIKRVWLSAKTGQGVATLIEVLKQYCATESIHTWLRLPIAAAGKYRARIFEHGKVVSEKVDADGELLLEITLPRKYLGLIEGVEKVAVLDNS